MRRGAGKEYVVLVKTTSKAHGEVFVTRALQRQTAVANVLHALSRRAAR